MFPRQNIKNRYIVAVSSYNFMFAPFNFTFTYFRFNPSSISFLDGITFTLSLNLFFLFPTKHFYIGKYSFQIFIFPSAMRTFVAQRNTWKTLFIMKMNLFKNVVHHIHSMEMVLYYLFADFNLRLNAWHTWNSDTPSGFSANIYYWRTDVFNRFK